MNPKLATRNTKPVLEGPFDRWAPRLIPALVFVVPLFFLLDLYDTFDLPKLTLVYYVDLMLFALWVRQALARGVLIIRRSALDLPLLLFLIATGVSVILSIEPRLSLLGAFQIYVFGWFPMLAFAALYWFTAQAASESLQKRVQIAALGSAVGVSLYAVLQYFGYEVFERMPAPRAAGSGQVWAIRCIWGHW